MKIRTILLCLLVVFLSTAAWRRYEPWVGERNAYNSLEKEQRELVGDMRRLHRDLRRGASESTISAEREEIRRDWHDIATDRGLARYGHAPALMELARLVHSRIEPYR